MTDDKPEKLPYLARKLAPTVIPVHGHGRLLPGGQPGHKGAGGRPPAVFRDWVKEIFQSEAAGEANLGGR